LALPLLSCHRKEVTLPLNSLHKADMLHLSFRHKEATLHHKEDTLPLSCHPKEATLPFSSHLKEGMLRRSYPREWDKPLLEACGRRLCPLDLCPKALLQACINS